MASAHSRSFLSRVIATLSARACVSLVLGPDGIDQSLLGHIRSAECHDRLEQSEQPSGWLTGELRGRIVQQYFEAPQCAYLHRPRPARVGRIFRREAPLRDQVANRRHFNTFLKRDSEESWKPFPQINQWGSLQRIGGKRKSLVK